MFDVFVIAVPIALLKEKEIAESLLSIVVAVVVVMRTVRCLSEE